MFEFKKYFLRFVGIFFGDDAQILSYQFHAVDANASLRCSFILFHITYLSFTGNIGPDSFLSVVVSVGA